MQNEAYFEIKTARLLLRTLTEEDADMVLNFNSDEFKTKTEALAYIRWLNNKAYENRLIYCFYIWLATINQCIGRVYIHSKPELNGEVEIGYGIAEAYRNQGYATEAGTAAVKFAFEKAGLPYLVAIVKPENLASRRVVEKLGFLQEGIRIVQDENGMDCDFEYFRLRSDQS